LNGPGWWAGALPFVRWLGSPAYQLNQARASVLPVLILRTVAAGFNDEHTLLRQAFAGDTFQPGSDRICQGRALLDIKAQLNRGGGFVDVLAARSRRADESLLEFSFIDLDGWGDL
jgi:hypothetical protein